MSQSGHTLEPAFPLLFTSALSTLSIAASFEDYKPMLVVVPARSNKATRRDDIPFTHRSCVFVLGQTVFIALK